LLRVSIDDVEVLVAYEPSPLPAGTFSVRGVGLDGSGLIVDDVNIWVPPSEIEMEVSPSQVTEDGGTTYYVDTISPGDGIFAMTANAATQVVIFGQRFATTTPPQYQSDVLPQNQIPTIFTIQSGVVDYFGVNGNAAFDYVSNVGTHSLRSEVTIDLGALYRVTSINFALGGTVSANQVPVQHEAQYILKDAAGQPLFTVQPCVFTFPALQGCNFPQGTLITPRVRYVTIIHRTIAPVVITTSNQYYGLAIDNVEITTQTAPRDVSDPAIAFHERNLTLGLPVPFESLPYVASPCPTSVSCLSDPLGWISGNAGYAIQGFGPTTFAFENSIYGQSYAIHNGVDYGNAGIWVNRVVVSLCDGVVIPGNLFDNGQNLGGSAQPGRGVSVRCFMDTLTSGNADTDGDGNPDLSNIVVTYNHLLGNTNPALLNYIDCSLLTGTTVTCTGQYEVPRINDVVTVNTPLGQTQVAFDFDHLHLSVFFARGFSRNTNNTGIAFNLNPMLMYSQSIHDLHVFQRYYPQIADNEVDTRYGIAACTPNTTPPLPIWDRCELNRWSGGGYNQGNIQNTSQTAYNALPSNSFWNVQIPTPSSNDVEWSVDYYPLRPANVNDNTVDLIEYLDARFPLTSLYNGPDCILTNDISRSRQVADVACVNAPDLAIDTSWTVSPH
jgi:hypothetical protein